MLIFILSVYIFFNHQNLLLIIQMFETVTALMRLSPEEGTGEKKKKKS